MRILIAIIFFIIPLSIYASEKSLIGNWEGGDTASMSIYGVLTISKKFISWEKNNNYSHNCKLSYKIGKEKSGVVFKDQTRREYVTSKNSKFSTFLLKITNDNCNTGIVYFRLTFPSKDKLGYLAMVEYNKSREASGWMHFYKKN